MTSWRRARGHPPAFPPGFPSGFPLILGHRGSSARCPENSVAAFQRAVADGADGVELDVLCCATGEVVVFHDDDLVRLGGRPERIADLPYASLRDVVLTSGARIPTLEEVLAACPAPLLVNIELKASGVTGGRLPALVDGVAALVQRMDAGARVLVSSFHPRAVFLWQRRAPAIPAALLFEREGPIWLRRQWAIPLLRPLGVHPEAVLCTPARVAAWHQRAHLVNVWTVDEPERLRALAAMGVDGIITNDPKAARTVLDAAVSG
ncbi:MAG TPA: glycerophosphodiester phosphodiesterase [Polyangia bacterium]|nr:glycerophosphodiester phosphodiesterase [Polyangia bacterium]